MSARQRAAFIFDRSQSFFFSAINYPDVPRNHSQSGNAGRSRPPLASVRADADAVVEALTSSKGEKIQASFVFPLQFCVFPPPPPPPGVCTGSSQSVPGFELRNSKLPSGASRLPLTRGPATTWRRVRGVAGMGFRQPPSAPGKRYRKSGRTKEEKQNQMYFFSHVSHELSYRAGTCYCQ